MGKSVLPKEEWLLIEKIAKCKTRKCAKLNKKREKEEKIFLKEQDIACPQKSDDEFYDCSVGFYEKSKYKKLYDKFTKCGERKCSKERKTLKKLRDKQEYNFIKSLVKKIESDPQASHTR